MSDLISRQAAINMLCSKCTVDKPETCSTIQKGDNWCEEVYTLLNMPSAEPEIIRCKECKKQDIDNVFRSMWCYEMRTFVKPNEFCSRADMRGEQDG